MKANELDPRLLSPDVEAKVVQIAQEAAMRDEAGRRAAAEPLPGPAKTAFTLDPDIAVGPYKVRPACDYDLVVLSQLNSKFYDFFIKGNDDDALPTGSDAWELAFIMTRPAREIAKLIREEKVAGLKARAQEEFCFHQTRDLTQIIVAAVRQIALSCATVTGHQTPAENGEVAKSAIPPSGVRLTA